MLEIPENIFNRNFETIELGANNISFFKKENLEKEQIGYRFDNTKSESKDWFGKEFLVIGKEESSRNPIIAKTNDEKIPIYMMFGNDKITMEKVADSFEGYVNVLNMIDNTDLYRKDKINNLMNDIEKIVPQNSMYYWNGLVNDAFNYLVD